MSREDGEEVYLTFGGGGGPRFLGGNLVGRSPLNNHEETRKGEASFEITQKRNRSSRKVKTDTTRGSRLGVE